MKWVMAALALGLMLPACDSILGIKDAELDPQAGQTACERYCTVSVDACTNDFAVYASTTVCNDVCQLLPEGQEGDTIGDTIFCRLNQAEQAAANGEQDAHCPAAGPAGNDVCGSNCEAFCVLFEAACASDFADDYINLADCQQKCASDIPDIGGFSINDLEGDSIQCRLYHVSAAVSSPAVHCPHAAGDEKCVVAGAGGAGGGSTVSSGVGGAGGAPTGAGGG